MSEIFSYQDRFTGRVRQTRSTGKPSYQSFIREVIAGFPAKWHRASKREIGFILQDHLYIANFQQSYERSSVRVEGNMIKCVARPLTDSEPCLIIGFKLLPLVIKCDNKIIEVKASPVGGWDYGSLENACEMVKTEFSPLDAYLGESHWVGSTEI